MKNIFGDKRHSLGQEIHRILEQMKDVDPKSNEYKVMAENLSTLLSAKKNKESKIKLDTVVTGIFSLLGIAMIIYSEETKILSSKAMGFVLKGRV